MFINSDIQCSNLIAGDINVYRFIFSENALEPFYTNYFYLYNYWNIIIDNLTAYNDLNLGYCCLFGG